MNDGTKEEGLFQLFLAEARDHLDAAEECLLRLEKQADDREAIQSCFRAMHTLKGCSSFFQVSGIERMSHACEQMLDGLRGARLQVDAESLSLLLDGTGVISRLLARLAQLERLDEFSVSEASLLSQDDMTLLDRIMDIASPRSAKADPGDEVPGVPPSLEAEFLAEAQDLLDTVEQVLLTNGEMEAEDVREAFRGVHTLKGIASYLGRTEVADRAHLAEELFLEQNNGETRRTMPMEIRTQALRVVQDLRGRLHQPAKKTGATDNATVPPPSVAATTPPSAPIPVRDQAPPAGNPPATAVAGSAETRSDGRELSPGFGIHDESDVRSSIGDTVGDAPHMPQAPGDLYTRVATARLEDLVNLVGELAISHAMIARTIEASRMTDLQLPVGRQSHTLRQLQVLVLSMRMVPLRTTFRKMARAVHDASQRSGKRAVLRTEGEDTEIDRSMAESLADPLMHLVRNAVDHGLEDARSRAQRGKPPVGTVELSASQVGEQIVIKVGDDGGGVDLGQVRTKAIERGLLQPDSPVSDDALIDMLFQPGFTTRDQVSDLSGRGVGLDVVRTKVEHLKGTVELHSTPGKGATFIIRVPLTTAILDVLAMRSGGERFLVPVSAVLEAVKIDAGSLHTILAHGMVYSFRGNSLPVVSLLGLMGNHSADSRHQQLVLLVLERQGGRVALLVDEIVGMTQVVIKPLPARFGHHPGLSGSAIMPDGRVGLIIDPQRLLVTEAVT